MLIRIYLPVFLLVLVACLSACQKAEPVQPVKIGIIAYLQGEQRDSEGLPTLNAAQMALADFEAQGGLIIDGVAVPVELLVEGIAQTQEAAVAATRKLISREMVDAIVGPQYSSDAIPSGDLAEQARVPMICPVSTNPKTTAGRRFVFRMSFLDDEQGAAMATVALDRLSARRAAVLFNEADEYSRGIAAVFRDDFARKGEIVAFESYVTGDTDFHPQMQRIRTAHPDVLFLPSYHNDATIQAELARRLDIDAVLLGTDGWDQRQVPALTAFDNSYFSIHWSPQLANPETEDFSTRYFATYQLNPNGTAALTYDAVRLLLKAMQLQQETTPAAIRDGLLLHDPYPGVGGLIDFVDSGDPRKPVVIMHVKDGRVRLLDSEGR